MSDWRPLTSRTGQVTDVKFDSDGRIIVRSRQECDDVLWLNKEQRNSGEGRDTRGLGTMVARIPNAIVAKWLTEDGIDIWGGECQAELARKLNDPDWAYLRTGGGYIGVSNGVAR